MSTVATCRKNKDRRPAPPPPSELGDELERTAQQVRLGDRDDSVVHELAHAWSDLWCGATYRTRCDHVLTGEEGAILTTRPANCGRCLRGGT